MTVDVVVVADGPPRAATTNSGVARGVTNAFEALPGVEVVAAIDSTPSRMVSRVLRLMTFRPSRSWWWKSYRLGLLNIVARSITRDRLIRKAGVGSSAVVLHVRNLYWPARRPYAIFVDTAVDLAAQSWAPWRPSRLTLAIRRAVERRSMQRAQAVFTAGRYVADHVVARYGLDRARVFTVGGGINVPDANPAALNRPVGRLRLAWVGMDFRRKGGDLVVRAFDELRARGVDCDLVMVGRVPDELARRSDIECLGLLSSTEDVAVALAPCHVLVHPARHEPFGIAIQEAMALGVVPIVSAVGALPEIVGGGEYGVVVPQPSPDSLATALAEVASDLRGLSSWSLAIREHALENCTWEGVARRIYEGLRKVVGDGAEKGEA